ncbi:MAG: YicC family protein, partial [Treponema sp.]|nr:YicC family protein [Treponema sp.]
MNSMTGYAYKEDLAGTAQISVEIKSVNNRFLDLSVSLPSFLNPIEQ